LGYFDDSSEPEQLAAETIFGIAEHDNGWWEWEASPTITASDKLPKGLDGLRENTIRIMREKKKLINIQNDSNCYV